MANILKLWFTRYVDASGKRVSTRTPGATKVRERSDKWFGQYTDSDGVRRRVPLSSNKVVARQMLAELVKKVELGKVGITDPFGEHRSSPIASHVDDYETYLRNKGVSVKHLAETMRRLRAVLDACDVRVLADLRAEVVERFLASLAEKGAGARTRNTYLGSAKAFTKWCRKGRRLGDDPLFSLEPATGETRRERRVLPDAELVRLIHVAQERPLLDAMTIRRGKRKGQAVARVRPEVRDQLVLLGRERGLMYKMLVLTGLRRNELQHLEVRHLTLTGPRPLATPPSAAQKNRKAASIRLREDLVEELAAWIRDTGRVGTDRIFRVPVELVKILKRDLKLAGIPYKDAVGRSFDVHSFRHTTGTSLG